MAIVQHPVFPDQQQQVDDAGPWEEQGWVVVKGAKDAPPERSSFEEALEAQEARAKAPEEPIVGGYMPTTPPTAKVAKEKVS